MTLPKNSSGEEKQGINGIICGVMLKTNKTVVLERVPF
jgi:hypothetical protein